MRKEVIGDATLYLGDCLDILPTLEPVDAVITDPPYSEHVHSKSRAGGAGRGLTDDGYTASYSRAAELGFPALTPDERTGCAAAFARLSRRWVLIFSDVESCHLWRDELVANDMDYCRTGVWHKLNATPQFTGDRPATAVEAITIAHPKGRKRWNGGGTHAIWQHAIEINRNGKSERLHTTQKPLPLMGDLVRDFTDPGEVILDSFAGSGTTGLAALQLGRKFVGIEKNEVHFSTACRRLEAFYKQVPLFTPSGPAPRQLGIDA